MTSDRPLLPMLSTDLQIRPATPSDDRLIAQHFYQMWRDNQVPEEAIAPHWMEMTLEFIDQARQTLNYQAYLAEMHGQAVGSVGCQIFAGLYPNIMHPTVRRDGYIWGVYVEAAYRRRGIATQLMQQAIAYLSQLGCTHAVLNASPPGRPVYQSMGFEDSNLMRLRL